MGEEEEEKFRKPNKKKKIDLFLLLHFHFLFPPPHLQSLDVETVALGNLYIVKVDLASGSRTQTELALFLIFF